ncbi:hypothetical protein, partial [Streptomyces sp. NPDC048349]|uniref:hypothetical protein n=1 Tax=Streptomyces sp. NPDC048349 TaxID=3155486 RepID=UPI00342F83CC
MSRSGSWSSSLGSFPTGSDIGVRRLPDKGEVVKISLTGRTGSAGLVEALMRDKETGKRWVPIVPDEARTFGMESL